MPLRRPIVCVVTRARGVEGSPERQALLERLAAAAAAGAAMIQVRERQLSDRALAQFVRELIAHTRETACRILVNDRSDIAIATGAAGVHLKAHSVAPTDARRIAPVPFLIGRSVHSEEEAASIEAAGGCDYLLFGTVFRSASKPDDHPIAGIDALRRVCTRVTLPVLAIGGVDVPRAGAVVEAGAAGVAAISLFAESADIGTTVAALRDALTPQPRSVKLAGDG
jgi:thiamine-phosphate diphosphorylase